MRYLLCTVHVSGLGSSNGPWALLKLVISPRSKTRYRRHCGLAPSAAAGIAPPLQACCSSQGTFSPSCEWPPRSLAPSSTTAPASSLVASCGLAPSQARKTAEKALKEASKASKKAFQEISFSRAFNPDAVLAVLYSVGLARADIAPVVAADPLFLRSSVKKIERRLHALRDRVGLSPPQIARLLLVSSRVLRRGDIEANVEFLISFYGSFDKVLVMTKRSRSLLTTNLEKVIQPNIALFRRSGVGGIDQLRSNAPYVLTFKLERAKEFLLRAEQLGVPPTSQMFKYALAVVACHSRDKVAAKLDFFKRTLGCSQSEVSIAVPKMPQILNLADDNLLRHFEFLVNEVGMERQYILERPVLFGLSLEKRLVPRHYVMKVLLAKGLLNSNAGFYGLAMMGEENFRLKFIDCHKDSVPGLADGYAAVRAGVGPSKV
ncbi:hypothetical protein BS78_10G008500 [Paspalum vaginatum]|nr:hypothetical protein BS78_10G008500 [Paspalum vaginatum]